MSRQAWASEIGVELDEANVPTLASVAAHIRAATASEGHLTSHRIVRGLKEAYSPFAGDDAQVHKAIHQVLDSLVDIGDLTRFSTSAGPAYVATPERLIDIGGDRLAVLGASATKGEVGEGLVRTIPKAAATSAPVQSLADEVGPAAWRLYLVGLGGTDAPLAGPSALFGNLAGAAASGDRIEPLGSDNLRVIAGTGDFFGNGRAIALEGRWKEWSGGEAACGLRKSAYNWQPCVVTDTAHGVRVVDVVDPDCWRWAVVGQRLSTSEPVAKLVEDVFQWTTPPPRQIRRLLTLAGEPVGPWRWRVGSEAADLADQLLGQN